MIKYIWFFLGFPLKRRCETASRCYDLGPNLLHYKTIQEIELQRELEETAKQIAASLVRGKGGLAQECQAGGMGDEMGVRFAEMERSSLN